MVSPCAGSGGINGYATAVAAGGRYTGGVYPGGGLMSPAREKLHPVINIATKTMVTGNNNFFMNLYSY
jgi:hypothetical protein